MDRTLTGQPSQSKTRPGSNSNEGVLYIPPELKHHPSDKIQCHTQDTFFFGWDTISVF